MTTQSLGRRRSAKGPLDIDPIVDQMALASRRRRLRFTVAFALTWVVVIGGFTLWLLTLDRFDIGFIAQQAPYILAGAPLTVFISVASIGLAIGLAFVGALGRISKRAPIYALATLYVSAVRGTPLIFQVLFVYLALPQLAPETAKIPAILLGIFALAFNYGAYLTEIFRAGIEAVPRGQREAALALGLPQRRIMGRIVLPQALRIVTPAIGNEFIAMIKDSALISLIGVQELLWRARTVGTANFRTLEMLLLAAGVYWILTMVFSYFQERLEQRMARSDR
jgi:polar amino acid transport system permease protein